MLTKTMLYGHPATAESMGWETVSSATAAFEFRDRMENVVVALPLWSSLSCLPLCPFFWPFGDPILVHFR